MASSFAQFASGLGNYFRSMGFRSPTFLWGRHGSLNATTCWSASLKIRNNRERTMSRQMKFLSPKKSSTHASTVTRSSAGRTFTCVVFG